jgi:hypothetical protein
MTPPVALSWLAFRAESFNIGYLESITAGEHDAMGAFLGVAIGLIIWLALSAAFWRMTVRGFNRMAGRRKIVIIAHYPKLLPVASSQ